jgi:hypothetical protein
VTIFLSLRENHSWIVENLNSCLTSPSPSGPNSLCSNPNKYCFLSLVITSRILCVSKLSIIFSKCHIFFLKIPYVVPADYLKIRSLVYQLSIIKSYLHIKLMSHTRFITHAGWCWFGLTCDFCCSVHSEDWWGWCYEVHQWILSHGRSSYRWPSLVKLYTCYDLPTFFESI